VKKKSFIGLATVDVEDHRRSESIIKLAVWMNFLLIARVGFIALITLNQGANLTVEVHTISGYQLICAFCTTPVFAVF